MRALLVAIWIGALLPQAALGQSKRAEPAPACTAACAEVCLKETTASGCNPAVGLTACRIKQDKCVAACTRKCPHA